MVFVIGLICFLVGVVMIRFFGTNAMERLVKRKQHNKWDYIGAVLFFLGIILMIVSICIKLWHYMP
jgi:uncharacterized membrane protein YidH (DUF202 family)